MDRTWWAFLAGALTLGSCAARESDTAARLAALEARVARMEAADAGSASSALDASVPNARVIADDDAGLRLFIHGSPKVDRLAECKATAEENCRRFGGDGGLGWEGPTPANRTPEGKECLESARKHCDQRAESERRRERVAEWLDAQLLPEKIDKPYTESVRARIDKEIIALGDKLDFACTAQFCRMKLEPGTYPSGLLNVPHFVDGGGAMSRVGEDDSSFYMPRKGFQFPR